MVKESRELEVTLQALEALRHEKLPKNLPLIALSYWALGKPFDQDQFMAVLDRLEAYESFFSPIRCKKYMIVALLITLMDGQSDIYERMGCVLDKSGRMSPLSFKGCSMMHLFRELTDDMETPLLSLKEKTRLMRKAHPFLVDSSLKDFLQVGNPDQISMNRALAIYDGLRNNHFIACKGLLWLSVMLAQSGRTPFEAVEDCTRLNQLLTSRGFDVSADNYILLSYLLDEVHDMHKLIDYTEELIPYLLKQEAFREVSVENLLFFISVKQAEMASGTMSGEEIYRFTTILHRLVINQETQVSAMAAL